MTILGVDPGEKRIGLAISDPSETLARPLHVLEHTNRQQDAAAIAALAAEMQVELIVVGQATDVEGRPNFSGRKARRLAGAIRACSAIPVALWDESYSTKDAQSFYLGKWSKKEAHERHLDDRAAAVILQSYLDAHRGNAGL